MPDEILTPDDSQRPVAGFFGKLPTTGDFVWRGLPDAFRRAWDVWLTRHIAPLQRRGVSFPEGGLRFRVPSGGRSAAGMILPSRDSADRLYPLALLLIADGSLSPEAIDHWCDGALLLDPLRLGPDPLWHALDALPAPQPEGPATGPALFWALGHPVCETIATDPDNVLQSFFNA
jgi:type VI secretion system protein ImpM